tara:strand:+ start:3249 stop:4178 length:930 start_codon:yes stop_codon:yes gene_type:complete
MNTIALSKINLKAPTQLWSSGEDMSHVEDLAHSFADTGSFKELPWVALIKDTNEYVPIDGFHRLTALQWLAEHEDIECQVDLDNVSVRLSEFDTMPEAIVAAAGVNANHGLKRKSTDIHNAIQKLLEVDRIGFSKTKYTLDSEAIMKVVNCSSATYRRATEEIRKELTDARDFEVKRLDYEGISQREIQQRTGVPQKTISRILSESKRSVSKMTHDETLDGLGEQKRHSAKITQSKNEQGDQKRHSAKNGHSSNEQVQSADKRHDAKTQQDRIQKRKVKLIESITRQLSSLSVEQLKSVDGHIATVSDF